MPEAWEDRWKSVHPVAPGLIWAFVGLLVVGVGAFLAGLILDPARAWQIYLVNFLFWGPLAQGAVVVAAVYHVVKAKWGPPIRRLAEGMVSFLPVSFLLFFPLYVGLGLFFSQVHELNPNRGAWFDSRFIFVRGGLGLGSMAVVSLLFVYYSLRPEVGVALERGLTPPRRLYAWFAEEWNGEQVEIQRSQRGMDVLATGVLLAYPITYTFMAFDLIMALDPFWYSSLFGGHFFISTFYLGLAGLMIVATLLSLKGNSGITPGQLADLGKLTLGFTLTYAAMLWSQYIVIWYGNLPEETHFVVLRLWERPWMSLSWTALGASVFLPFVVLLSRKAKESPWVMLSVGILIAGGLWLERYVLVVPSLWHGEGPPFGWLEIGVTAGFLGAAGVSYAFFLQYFPILPLVRTSLAEASNRSGGKSLEKSSSRV